jgi:hypothetical protein
MFSIVNRIVRAGRIKHAFAASTAIAAFVIPTVTALAFFAATGTGTIPTVLGGSPSSVVTIASDGTPYVYAGPSTTTLMPGGTVSIGLRLVCTAGCPAQVTTVNLSSWVSDKAGCDAATFPGSFTMPALPINSSIALAGSSGWGPAIVTYVNLAANQNVCAGAHFTFTLVTP